MMMMSPWVICYLRWQESNLLQLETGLFRAGPVFFFPNDFESSQDRLLQQLSSLTTSNLATTSGRAPERGDLIANRLQYRRHSMHHFRPRWKQKANGDRFILFQFKRKVVKYYKCLSPPGINPPTFTGKKQLWIGEHPPLPSEDISSKMFFLQRATNGGCQKSNMSTLRNNGQSKSESWF